MRNTVRAFTLIELMLVMVLIALLMALLVPEIPALINFHKVVLSKSYMQTLCDAIREYKRVFGDYPSDWCRWHKMNSHAGGCTKNDDHMLNGDTDTVGLLGPNNAWIDPDVAHYGNCQGHTSLYLSLQGPDEAGWGPTTLYPRVFQFGPVPENPAYVARDRIYNVNLKTFVDPFGNAVLYYKARTSWPNEISEGTGLGTGRMPRYVWQVEQYTWWSESQRGANEGACYPTPFLMHEGVASKGPVHWRIRLTKNKIGSGASATLVPGNTWSAVSSISPICSIIKPGS